MKKLIVILGPTASGKSDLAIRLAEKFQGEVISADSRQVYQDMDIGTGKVTQKEKKGIPHYCLDIASPKRKFTVAQYRKEAARAIGKIHKKNKVPILCGGTGFYIQSIVDGTTIPEAKPDWELRKSLGKKSTKELYQMLKKLDPQRAKTIEKNNPRRLIRAIEIAKKIGSVPCFKKKPLPYPVLIIGIEKAKEDLEKAIEKRFFGWLKKGLIQEIKNLKKSGISWKRIEEFGIHYRIVAKHLQGKLSLKEMKEISLREIKNYAKRQMAWFKKDERIYWVKNQKEAESLAKEFLG